MIPLVLATMLLGGPAEGKPAPREVARPATLWASSEALRLCLEATSAEIDARLAYVKATGRVKVLRGQLAASAAGNREAVCARGTVLKMTEGMAVEASANPGACAPEPLPLSPQGLVRVRVTGGKDAGAVGCMMPSDLRDPVPF